MGSDLAASQAGAAPDARPYLNAVLLVGAGVLIGMTETLYPSLVGTPRPRLDGATLVLCAFGFAMALLAANTFWRLPWRQPATTVGLAFLGSLVAGWLGGVSWPNSADEYAYLYQAKTFALGRLWNSPPADPSLFEQSHIIVHAGRAFSPYPPGWAAVLTPFSFLDMTWLATPLATVALGVALDRAGRLLNIADTIRNLLLALVLLTPFTFFLGGSLFPQTVAGALAATIVWMQLRDEIAPSRSGKLLIGALFGALFLTRPDVFAIVAAVYAIDQVWRRKGGVIAHGVWVLAGFVPFAVCYGAYNAAITGDALQFTSTWGSEGVLDAGNDGAALTRTLYFVGGLAKYGGLPIAALGLLGLARKLRWRTVRFYDLLFPAAIVFYAFIPFVGGHQYGPRYWFWAWPFCALTGAAAVASSGDIRFWGRKVSIDGFASANLVIAIAVFCVLLVTTHNFITARRQIYTLVPPERPALVLVPTREVFLWPWQSHKVYMLNRDFNRNDFDLKGAVLYGRLDLPDALARACKQVGRDVYRWESGRLLREDCP